MEDGSDSPLRSFFKSIFNKNGHDLEDHILEAREEGEIEGDEVSMLLNILELDSRKVTEVLVPRMDMTCVEAASTVAEAAAAIVKQGNHSRIPVYHETRDHIVGVVHAKDLLPPLMEGDGRFPISDIMRPALFVPEETQLDEMLSLFKKEKVHIAVVHDHYGGTSGIVTMADILEEIVGEMADEHEAERPDEIEYTEDGALLVAGKVPLEDVCELCAVSIESEHVDSIGGYLAALAGHIPSPGEHFDLQNRRFTIRAADERHIILIRIDTLEQEEEDETQQAED